MMELEELMTLRKKLVLRRRMLVTSLHKLAPEDLGADSMVPIQSAIEAVDRAIEDEGRTGASRVASRQAPSAE
jgi:hypothetical protein